MLYKCGLSFALMVKAPIIERALAFPFMCCYGWKPLPCVHTLLHLLALLFLQLLRPLISRLSTHMVKEGLSMAVPHPFPSGHANSSTFSIILPVTWGGIESYIYMSKYGWGWHFYRVILHSRSSVFWQFYARKCCCSGFSREMNKIVGWEKGWKNFLLVCVGRGTCVWCRWVSILESGRGLYKCGRPIDVISRSGHLLSCW